MKPRPRRIHSLHLDELQADPDRTTRAARQRGGVNVVDKDGTVLFRLVIFSTPLPAN